MIEEPKRPEVLVRVGKGKVLHLADDHDRDWENAHCGLNGIVTARDLTILAEDPRELCSRCCWVGYGGGPKDLPEGVVPPHSGAG